MGNILSYNLIGGTLNSSNDNLLLNKSLTKTTYSELKNLRDTGKLIPGNLYRITDYQCATTQENTRSAGHQFDIVLLALSENKLAEEGWVMEHPTDVYDVTFGDGVTKKCYLYRENDESYNLVDVKTLLGTDFLLDAGVEAGIVNVNHQDKTIVISPEIPITADFLNQRDLIYNYFQRSNLSAWKVWYSLDNDKSRFDWADDSVDESSPATIKIIPSGGGLVDIKTYTRNKSLDVVKSDTQYYGWTAQGITPDNIYTTTETPAHEDNLFTLNKKGSMSSYSGDVISYTPAHEGTGLPNGRGVIYRLIDEWNNNCPYDFKNIQFVRPIAKGYYDKLGENTWVYTFSHMPAIADASVNRYMDDHWAFNNIILSTRDVTCYLPNNVLISDDPIHTNVLENCNGNTLLRLVNVKMFSTSDKDEELLSNTIYINGKKVLTEE